MTTPHASLPAAWLREQVTTTPGRLRLAAGVVAIVVIAYGVVAATAAGARRQAAESVATKTEPLLVQADVLYSSLSDADATAATTFLTGGLEPIARRKRYLRDLHSATAQLTTLAREVGDSPDALAAVSTVSTQLPVYSGLIETARANNRQGLPVGTAYLRQASSLMRETILPAAAQLYEVEARGLAADYRSGVSTRSFAVVTGAAFVTLAFLILVQLYLTRLSNRIINVPLLAATAVVLGFTIWTLTSFVLEQNALSSAQRNGSDSVEVLSATRILLLRAESDESLALAARGGGDLYAADFAAVMRALGPVDGSSGLLADEARLAERTGSQAAFDDLAATLVRYRALHQRIGALEANGQFREAVQLAVGQGAKEAPLADRLNTDLTRQIAAAQKRFANAASDATSALHGLLPGILLLVVGAIALVLFGFSLRITEYR